MAVANFSLFTFVKKSGVLPHLIFHFSFLIFHLPKRLGPKPHLLVAFARLCGQFGVHSLILRLAVGGLLLAGGHELVADAGAEACQRDCVGAQTQVDAFPKSTPINVNKKKRV